MGYREHKAIFERYYPTDGSPRESTAQTVRAIYAEYHCADRTVRGVLACLDVLGELGDKMPADEKQWRAITSKRTALKTYRVGWSRARTTYGHLCRFREEESAAEGAPPAGPLPSPHVTAVLGARDEVVALLRATPHPDTVLDEFQEREKRTTWMDPRSSVWPGVLAPTSLSMLFAHTCDDPRWAAFGLADRTPDQPANPEELSWLAAYDQAYMGPLLRLVGMLHWVYQEQVFAACQALGNSGPLLPFPAFVLRPIRDVVRMLTGLGPLSGPGYELRYLNPAPTGRPYTLHFGGEPIATGVDQRPGAQNNAVVDAVIRVHRMMAQRIFEAPDLRGIVRNWERLGEHAAGLAAWLESITAADIERGTCLVCREPEAGKPLGPELAEGVRRFFAGEPPAAPAADENADDPLDMHKIVVSGTVDIPAGGTAKVATVRVDGTVEYGSTFRPGGMSGTGAPPQPTAPPD